MMRADAFRMLALAMPEAALSSHFGAADIRIGGKIFAQPPEEPGDTAILKFTREQQEMMCEAEPALFAPVDGHWGRLGWTRLTVDLADEATMRGALWTAWRNVASAKLAKAHALKDAP